MEPAWIMNVGLHMIGLDDSELFCCEWTDYKRNEKNFLMNCKDCYWKYDKNKNKNFALN